MRGCPSLVECSIPMLGPAELPIKQLFREKRRLDMWLQQRCAPW